MSNNDLDKTVSINIHELAQWLAEAECKKTCSQLAKELYQTRGKKFCIGLALHLTMYISGAYEGGEEDASEEEK